MKQEQDVWVRERKHEIRKGVRYMTCNQSQKNNKGSSNY